MNCEKFETMASELARDEIMEANERVSALAHSDECAGLCTNAQQSAAIERRPAGPGRASQAFASAGQS